MATNLALDQELLDRAFRVSGEPTKKAAVTRALQGLSPGENSGGSQSFLESLSGTLRSITRLNGLASIESSCCASWHH
jgi:hypothetical protein